jgi:hypothetical protein
MPAAVRAIPALLMQPMASVGFATSPRDGRHVAGSKSDWRALWRLRGDEPPIAPFSGMWRSCSHHPTYDCSQSKQSVGWHVGAWWRTAVLRMLAASSVACWRTAVFCLPCCLCSAWRPVSVMWPNSAWLAVVPPCLFCSSFLPCVVVWSLSVCAWFPGGFSHFFFQCVPAASLPG